MTTTANRGRLFKGWVEKRVAFNEREAEDWVENKPVSDEAKDILEWVDAHPFLKSFAYQVPSEIVAGKKCTLHDVKVNPPRAKKGPRVMDDEIYDLFPYLRTYVPRGLCILQTETEGISKYEVIVSAMRKFTGGPGDEDDDEEEDGEEHRATEGDTSLPKWERYFLAPHATSTTILSTTKENGEASHLSVATIDGKNYYVIGSKNVHILLNDISEIALYTDSRFRVASLIANTMLTFLHKNIQQDKREAFLKYMADNKFTATFEYLQCRLRVVKELLSGVARDAQLADMEKGIEIAKQAGFEATQLSKYSFAQQEEVYNNIRFKSYGKEGGINATYAPIWVDGEVGVQEEYSNVPFYFAQPSNIGRSLCANSGVLDRAPALIIYVGAVLYYVNAQGRTIGMMKKKTIWYILVRSLREKARGYTAFLIKKAPQDYPPAEITKLHERRKGYLTVTLQQKKEWLGFNDAVFFTWENIGHKMLDWILENITNKQLTLEEVASLFPVVWNRFLKETKLSDRVDFETGAML